MLNCNSSTPQTSIPRGMKFSKELPYETASSTEDLMILFEEEKKAVKHLKKIKSNEKFVPLEKNLSKIIDTYLNLVDYNE